MRKEFSKISLLSDPCPTYYTLLGDSCYLIDQNQTWSHGDAHAHCLSRGGHLVDLKTEDEMNAVINWVINGRLT